MPKISFVKSGADRQVLWFLCGWFILNLVQAGFCELHPDEAYYWVYSRFPAWGYFDHPPMVALFIKAGYFFFRNELGVRLFTTLSQCAGLYMLWKISAGYGARPRVFCLAAAGLTIIHVYGFTATPDAPLFFFGVCFFYRYKSYLENNTTKNALLLGACIAALLFSKYHGLLLIIFTLLANPLLVLRRSFWLVAVTAIILFSPHIYWQAANNYPSLQYHLSERSLSGFKPDYALGFIPGQLLVAGPLTGWFVFYRAWAMKNPAKDPFLRMLKWNAVAFPLFLFALTFRQNIQPHWTLIAYIPILLLAGISLSHATPQWWPKLAAANILLIGLFRLLIIFPTPLVNKVAPLYAHFGNKKWAEDIRRVAGNRPVVFYDHWQNAARYDFYTRSTLGYAYASYTYRKSQFDFFPVEKMLQQQSVWVQSSFPINNTSRFMGTGRNGYLTYVPRFNSRQMLDVDTDREKITAKKASRLTVNLTVSAPQNAGYGLAPDDSIHFIARYRALGGQRDTAFSLKTVLQKLHLRAGQQQSVPAVLLTPAQPGRYELSFSFWAAPLPGGRNSRRIPVSVY